MNKQTFEDFLMETHADGYEGTKDCMVDDFGEWVSNLSPDELIEYGDKFAKQQSKDLLEALKEISRGQGAYNPDRMEHAKNTIRDMVELAKQAIAKAEGG